MKFLFCVCVSFLCVACEVNLTLLDEFTLMITYPAYPSSGSD